MRTRNTFQPQSNPVNYTQTRDEAALLVKVMDFVFTRMPGKACCRRLLVCLGGVFPAPTPFVHSSNSGHADIQSRLRSRPLWHLRRQQVEQFGRVSGGSDTAVGMELGNFLAFCVTIVTVEQGAELHERRRTRQPSRPSSTHRTVAL